MSAAPAALAVTLEEMMQDGHPNPEASARRRFATPEDKAAWRETIRQGLYAARNRMIAEKIAHHYGEEI